jgi:hypothetical protein
MRHIVNFGLLLTFLALGITGVMAFTLPFSLTTTRVHIIAGLTTSILVLLHVFSRLPYFRRQLASEGAKISRGNLVVLVLVWGGLVASAIIALPPGTWLMNQSYEARNRAEIVRSSSLLGFGEPSPHRKLIVRTPQHAGSHGLSLYASFPEGRALPAIAVWAETRTGTMIETLYLPDELRFSDQVQWQNSLTRRSHVLPIWRNRYTAVSGIGPDGKVDATSGATATHSFALDPYLVSGEDQSFIVCVEVNAPSDPNETWPEGQPSLLYTAYIEIDAGKPYCILELTGHGGDAENNGNLQYDLEGFTTAKELVDLLLAKLEPPPSD